MIEYRTGDILSEEADALVNTVNCVGIMGRGVALQFKRAFPENFRAYAARCKRNEIRPGRVFVFDDRSGTAPSLDRQLPDQTPLAGQEPDGRHRGRIAVSRR